MSSGTNAQQGLLMWVLGVLGRGEVTPGSTKSYANQALLQLPPSTSTTSGTGTQTGSSTGSSTSVTQQGTIIVNQNSSTGLQTWVEAGDGNSGIYWECYVPGIANINPITGTYPYLNTHIFGNNYNQIDNVYNDVYNYYNITNGANGNNYPAVSDTDDNVYGFNNTTSSGTSSTVSASMKVSVAELSLSKPIFYDAWTRAASGYILDYQSTSSLTATQGYTVTYNPGLYPGYCVFLLSNGATDLTPLTANINLKLSPTDIDAIQNVGLTLNTQSGNFNLPANFVTASYNAVTTSSSAVGNDPLLTNFNRRGFVDTSLYFGNLAPVCVRVSLSQISMAGSTVSTAFQSAYTSLMTKLYLSGLLMGWSQRVSGSATTGFTLVPQQTLNTRNVPNWYLCVLTNPFKGITYNDGTTVHTFSGTVNVSGDTGSISSIMTPTTYNLNTLDGKSLVIALIEHELFSVFTTGNTGILGQVTVLPISSSGTYTLTTASSPMLVDGVAFYRKTWPQNVPSPQTPLPPPVSSSNTDQL